MRLVVICGCLALLTLRQLLARLILPAPPVQMVLYSWRTILKARALSINLPNVMDLAQESLRGISAIQEVEYILYIFFSTEEYGHLGKGV